MPTSDLSIEAAANDAKWNKIMELRTLILGKLEDKRRDQVIASNQEASVCIKTANEDWLNIEKEMGLETFASLCIVSEVTIEKGDDLEITTDKCSHAKCERCWYFYPSVGQNKELPDLCQRCSTVVAD
jgi:isoleucyl-tRNA synthetase